MVKTAKSIIVEMKTVFCILVFTRTSQAQEYTEWTTLLWLKDSTNQDPHDVWTNSGSGFNSNSNQTIFDLYQASSTGYRNTLIDTWANSPPDKVRVTYRNGDAGRLFSMSFNGTESTFDNWFATERLLSSPLASQNMEVQSNADFTSYGASFSVLGSPVQPQSYFAASIRNSTGSTSYIIHHQTPLFLPASPNGNDNCVAFVPAFVPVHALYFNFTYNGTGSGMHYSYCSAACREQNMPNGGLFDEDICGCANFSMTPRLALICDLSCSGGIPGEHCGATSQGSIPPPGFYLSFVETDIDFSAMNTPVGDDTSLSVTGSLQVDYPQGEYVFGFKLTASTTQITRMELEYNQQMCNETPVQQNITNNFTFPLTTGLMLSFEIEAIFVKCLHITLYDDTTNNTLTSAVTVIPKTLQQDRFALATYLTIEASWKIEPPPPVNVTQQCECECWLFDMLYGQNPYENLTYDEIAVALKNVTDKLEKELAVNKSTLSSTIRKKTSAKDDRPSAQAVGYALGVALLVVSLGAIFLGDLPRILESSHLFFANIKSRFCREKP